MEKEIKFREAQKILLNNGFEKDRVKGRHYHYVRNGMRVIIYPGLNRMVWQRLIKENQLNID